MTAATFGIGRILVPDQSLDFSGTNSLSMTDADFGGYSLTKFALSIWAKVDSNPVYLYGQSSGTDLTSAFDLVAVNTGGAVRFIASSYHGSSSNTLLSTTAAGATAWQHLLLHYDPTSSTVGDRIKMWINGTLETAYSASLLNNSAVNNSSAAARIGANYYNFTDKIYQPAFFSGTLPDISAVYSAGHPKDVRGISGLYSYIDTSNGNITDDYVLAASWTNNGSVSLSTDIPT